jgi:hypothetical protein
MGNRGRTLGIVHEMLARPTPAVAITPDTGPGATGPHPPNSPDSTTKAAPSANGRRHLRINNMPPANEPAFKAASTGDQRTVQ